MKYIGKFLYKLLNIFLNILLFIVFYIYILASIFIWVPLKFILIDRLVKGYRKFKAYMNGPNRYSPIEYDFWEDEVTKRGQEKYLEQQRIVEMLQMMAEIRRREIMEYRRKNPDFFYYLNYYINDYESANVIEEKLKQKRKGGSIDHTNDQASYYMEFDVNMKGNGAPIDKSKARLASFDEFKDGDIIPDDVYFPPHYFYNYDGLTKEHQRVCIEHAQQTYRPYEVLPNKEKKRVKLKLYQIWGHSYYIQESKFAYFKKQNRKTLLKVLFYDMLLFVMNEFNYLLFSTIFILFSFPLMVILFLIILFIDIFYHMPVKFLTDRYNFFIVYPRWVEKKEQAMEEFMEPFIGFIGDLFMRVIVFCYAVTLHPFVYIFMLLYHLIGIACHYIFFKFLYVNVIMRLYILLGPKIYRYFLKPVLTAFVKVYLWIFRLLTPKKLRRKVHFQLVVYGLRKNLTYEERVTKHRNFWIYFIFGVTRGLFTLFFICASMVYLWGYIGGIFNHSFAMQSYSTITGNAYLWVVLALYVFCHFFFILRVEIWDYIHILFGIGYGMFYIYHLGQGDIYSMTFPDNPFMPYGEPYKIHWKWIETGSWVQQWKGYFYWYYCYFRDELHPWIKYVFTEIENWRDFWKTAFEFIWKDTKELIIPNFPLYNLSNLKVPNEFGEFVNFEEFHDTFIYGPPKPKSNAIVWEFGRANVIAYLKELEELRIHRAYLAAREEDRKSRFLFFFDKSYRDYMLTLLANRPT